MAGLARAHPRRPGRGCRRHRGLGGGAVRCSRRGQGLAVRRLEQRVVDPADGPARAGDLDVHPVALPTDLDDPLVAGHLHHHAAIGVRSGAHVHAIAEHRQDVARRAQRRAAQQTQGQREGHTPHRISSVRAGSALARRTGAATTSNRDILTWCRDDDKARGNRLTRRWHEFMAPHRRQPALPALRRRDQVRRRALGPPSRRRCRSRRSCHAADRATTPQALTSRR